MQRIWHPLTRPAPADEDAGAVHPLPQGGEGWVYFLSLPGLGSTSARKKLDSRFRGNDLHELIFGRASADR